MAAAATRKGLLLTGLFTIQALLVYTVMGWFPYILISRGMTPAAAGQMLALVQVVSIPAVVLLLAMAARPGLLRRAFMLTCAASLAGYLALLVLPADLAVVPAVLIGLGFGVFPLLMLVISRTGSDAAETTALSTLAQSVGYLFAALGPFGLGLLHDALADWTVPLVLLVAGAVLQLLLAHGVSSLVREGRKWPRFRGGHPCTGRRWRRKSPRGCASPLWRGAGRWVGGSRRSRNWWPAWGFPRHAARGNQGPGPRRHAGGPPRRRNLRARHQRDQRHRPPCLPRVRRRGRAAGALCPGHPGRPAGGTGTHAAQEATATAAR